MPQVQWEQPQPVNSSPSTQIKRLFIHLPQSMHLEFELGRGEAEHINASSAEGELLPWRIFSPESPRNQVTNVLRPVSRESTPFFGV